METEELSHPATSEASSLYPARLIQPLNLCQRLKLGERLFTGRQELFQALMSAKQTFHIRH